MRKNARHTSLAWVVLICFVAGQLLALVHQHLPGYTESAYQLSKKAPQQTVTEKCYVCDMMHHTQMAIFINALPAPVVNVYYTRYTHQHDYTGIALILSAGRSPPALLS